MEANIVNVNEKGFEREVVEYSRQIPVIVDFWAPWCGPCRSLSPILEKLTAESAGSFRLAKVNVDESPGLSARFGIQGIPMVMAFRDGKPASSFSGALPETNVRKYFREWIPGPEEAAVAEATGFITSRHWPEAEASARRALQTTPGNSKAALLLLKAILAQGKGSLALDLLADFPSGNEVIAADRLRPLADWLAEAEASGDTGADESESGYLQAARLLAKGNILAALDGLLEVLRRDKHYRQDEARKVFIAILEILGDEDPLTRQYRDELASILF